jgi:endonuclease/exonuclease/phosphatase family metal-dependent hydrolase
VRRDPQDSHWTAFTAPLRSRASARIDRVSVSALRPVLSVVLTLGSLTACSADDRPADGAQTNGRFSLLTYNVAGLPQGISGSNPATNSALISPLLNAFDVVLIQEDFAYHADLVQSVTHPYRSAPAAQQQALGDGLTILSTLPIGQVERIGWFDCYGEFDSGSDCLTPKGFFLVEVQLGPDAFVDIYNLHADAGRGPMDELARAGNLEQLLDTLVQRSNGHAVIVAGDFNERYSYATQHLTDLVEGAALSDVWVEASQGGVFPPSPSEPPPNCAGHDENESCERIDKVLYRSSEQVELKPVGYSVEAQTFVDSAAQPLSDHPPVAARFDFILR